MKYFKVKIGFSNDDFISIEGSELKKAVIAQVTGKVVIFKEGSIAGNSIISVLPDYNKEMGWNRDYKLGAEDYRCIGDKRVEESRLLIENAVNEANGVKPLNPVISEGANSLVKIFKLSA